jgi:fumarate reductase flavoprotein subunit
MKINSLHLSERTPGDAGKSELAEIVSSARRQNMKKRTVDVCIIGAAGSGLMAACRAKEAGAKDVLVLEKMPKPGGCTQVAMGMFGVETAVQKRLGIQSNADQCYENHMLVSNYEPNGKLVHNWMRTSKEVFDWLEQRGVHFDDVKVWSGGGAYYHIAGDRTGHYLIQMLKNQCETLGVEILTQTPAKQLRCDEKGQVIGVIAKTKDGEELEVTAKSTIICSGSISNNAELRARFYPGVDFTDTKIMAAFPFNMGDGLTMAEEIGAKSTYISTLYIGPHNHGANPRVGLIMRRSYVVKVNRKGQRFVNEALPLTSDFGWMMSVAFDRQPGRICYALVDQAMMDDAVTNKRNTSVFEKMQGAVKGDSIRDTEHQENYDNETAWLDLLPADVESELKKGRCQKFDTIEEVARFIGCPEEDLRKTMAEYNQYCETGYDADFLKPAEYLVPYTDGPFYVFPSHQGIDTCVGGIAIDENFHVLDQEENPIPGLFCAGVAAGNWLAHNYAYWGSEMGFTFYSGYTVGKLAAEYAQKK